MFKTIGFMPRRADFSRAAFREYYESRHAPLALRHIRSFARYARNHVLRAHPEVPFDTLSEFWFEDASTAQAVTDWHRTPAAAQLHEDEARFMDRPRIAAFEVAESLICGPPREVEPGPSRREALLLRRAKPPGEEFLAAVKKLGADWARRDRLSRICLDVVVASGSTPPCGAILSAWAADRADPRSPLGHVPLLPPGAEALGCTHHLVLDCIETATEQLRD